jgi:putative ABC transport system permease protein
MMPFLHTKLIFRNLWRNRLYTGLNVTGLAIGMAAAMLIALWVQNELRFDQYHQRTDNLYRINTDLRIDANETWHWALTPLKITELCAQTPGVVATAQLMRPVGLSMVLQRGGRII